MATKNPQPVPAKSGLTAKEQLQKAQCTGLATGPACRKTVHVGVFFDGTNNNDKRDRPELGHSNVAKLWSSFKDERQNSFFRHYIAGVGTAFPEVGELTESSSGKAYAKGGDARIAWGVMQVLNSIRQAFDDSPLITPSEAKAAVQDVDKLYTVWALSQQKRRVWFKSQIARLKGIIAGKRPTIVQVNVSVFGFSRGAAEARAFVHWLLDCCEREGGGLTLAGAPLRVQFLGIFDTVASVGLADSFPLPVSGHFDWADGVMAIPPEVGQCVHYVAAHEIRASFPLNTGRNGKSYPGNVVEVVYPGAHSDVGGGYAPGEQGRSKGGVSTLLSTVPLLAMHRAAVKAGVPLLPIESLDAKTKQDFAVDETLRQAFNMYLQHSKVAPAKVENVLDEHMRQYRRYKAIAANYEADAVKTIGQDRQDLREASQDFKSEARKIELERLKYIPDYDPERLRRDHQDLHTPLPQPVLNFFLQYVHDSHAGFYLAGPVTKYDKEMERKRVKDKVAALERSLNSSAPYPVIRPGATRQLALEYLNRWERKVYAAPAGQFPVMTDEDQWDMLRGTDMVVRANTSTRREGSGYFRRRVVFDKS